MGTFVVIVLVLIGVPIIKSIIRDARLEEQRRARAAERRRRAKARTATTAPSAAPLKPSTPTTGTDGKTLIDDLGNVIVDGIVDVDIDASQSGVYRAVAPSTIHHGHDVDANHHPAVEPVEVEVNDVVTNDVDTSASDSGGWSWDDD